MSIRPSHHNFAGNTQNTSVARMQKMRERFNRWEHKANERKSMFIERQKARIERYRNAFKGSWISKIGLGLVALWNFITNPPFVVSIEKRATVPFTAMLPFGLRVGKNENRRKKKNKKSRNSTTRNRLMPETLEQRQLLAADITGLSATAGTYTEVAGPAVDTVITNDATPTFSVTGANAANDIAIDSNGDGNIDLIAPTTAATTFTATGSLGNLAVEEGATGSFTIGDPITAEDSVSVTVDTTDPVTTYSALTGGTAYTAAGGGSTTAWPGAIASSSADGNDIVSVDYTITQVATGDTWDGAAFTAGATSVTGPGGGGAAPYAESLAFPIGNFPANGDYTIVANATDVAGNVESSSPLTFTMAVTTSALVEFDASSSTSAEGDTTGGPFLSVDGVLATAQTVTITKIGGTATATDDFTTNGAGDVIINVTLPAGVYSGGTPIDLQAATGGEFTVVDDRTVEGTETAIFFISGGSLFGSIGDANSDASTEGTTTHFITDNDTAEVTLSGTSTALETAGTQDVSVALTLTTSGTGAEKLGNAVTVNLTQTGGAATSGTDYAFPPLPMVTFPANSPAGILPATLTISNDRLVEGDETAVLGLTGVTGPATASGSHTMTITDDDTLLVTPTGLTVAEASGAQTLVTYSYTFGGTGSGTPSLAGAVNITATSADGTAVAAGDYASYAASSLLGPTSLSGFSAVIADDGLLEGDEAFAHGMTLDTSLDGQVTLSTPSVDVTITDDEVATFDFDSTTATVTEVAGAGQASPGVELTIAASTGTGTIAPGVSVAVPVAVNTGSASAADFTAPVPGSVTFTAGEATGLVKALSTIDVVNDGIFEGDESFTLDLGGAPVVTAPAGVTATTVDASLAATDQSSTVTITDDESATLSISGGTSVTETGAATQQTGPVTLSISGTDGGGALAPGAGTVGSGVSITADVVDTGGGSAVNPADYGIGALSVSFTGGATDGDQDTVDVSPVNDWLLEGTETIGLQLTNLATAGTTSGVSLSGSSFATAFILDDEAAELSIGASSVDEESGAQNSAPVALTITGSGTGVKEIGAGITVSATVSDAANTAIAADYGFSDATVSFGPGSASGDIDFATTTPVNDFLLEGPEFFDVSLSAAAVAGGTAVVASTPGATNVSTVTINDDEEATIQFVNGASDVHEQDGTHTVDVGLSITGSGAGTPALAPGVTAAATVDNNTLGTANETADYTFLPQSATFGPGSIDGASVTLNMTVVNDALVELDEAAFLVITAPTGPATTLGSPALHTVTIGDRTVSITPNDSLPVENQTNNAQFTVGIDTSSTAATTVVFEIDPTSTAELGLDPKDFVFDPGQVTVIPGPNAYGADDVYSVVIPANSINTVIDIDLQDDLNFDPNETIILNLIDAVNGTDLVQIPVAPTVGSPTAMMTIVDNETGSTVSVAKSSTGNAREGGTPTTIDGEFTISLSTPVDADATVVLNIGTGGAGVAVPGVDYNFGGGALVSSTATTVTVLIPANTSSVTLDILPVSETATVELDETVTLTPASVTLASPPPSTGMVALGGGASLTIDDDDSATVNAGANSTGVENLGDMTITFNQTKPASTDTIINFSRVENADLTYGVDYVVYSNLDTGSVSESESNNNTSNANSLDSEDWNLAPNSAIGATSTTRPHLTVTGGGSNADYFKFTLLEDGVVDFVFSDAGGPSGNAELRSASNSIITGSLGSTLTAGTYYARVNANGNYTLHISAENVLNAAPSQAVVYTGDTSGTMQFNPIDDSLLEDDEPVTFTIDSLSGDADITIDTNNSPSPDHKVTVTITDDDTATVSLTGTGSTADIDNALANNGIEASTLVDGQFTVSISNQADEPVVVPFKINFTPPVSSTVSGDAVYGVDYTFDGAEVAGTGTPTDPFRVTIPANTSSTTFKVVVLDEAGMQDVEDDEKVVIELLDSSSPSTGPSAGINAIYGPYGFPTGDADITLSSTFIDSILIKDTDLAVVTVNSTIDTAVEGGVDGEWTIQLSERDSAFPTVATPIIPLSPMTSSVDTVVTYAITFGPGAGVGDLDAPIPVLTGSVTIPAGSPSVTIPLSALADSLNEGTEEVYLTVLTVSSGDSDVSIADPSTDGNDDTVFIEDSSDTTVTIAPTSVSQAEGNTGTTTVPFTVSLVGAALAPLAVGPITVNYTVTGSATAGADFNIPGGDTVAPITGSVVINPTALGTGSATIPVTVNGDTIVELDETVTITIDSISYGGPATISVDPVDSGTLTITNDDSGTVSIDATDQFAGEGINNGEFTVILSNPSSTGVLVNYSIITPGLVPPGTPHATEGMDFADLDGAVVGGGTVFVLPNQTTATIPVSVIDDMVSESGTKRLVVQLDGTGTPLYTVTAAPGQVDGSGGGSIGKADYVLFSPDQQVSVATGVTPAIEGSATGSFVISMPTASTTDTFVTYTLSAPTAGDALEGIDYATTTGTATITAGSTSTTVVIDPGFIGAVGDDLVIEGTENIEITLTGVTNTDAGADITVDAGSDTATLSILDDDAGYVTIAGVNDGTEGSTDGKFTVTLRDPTGTPTTSSSPTEIAYTVTGVAIDGTDYASLTPFTVTIPANTSTADIDIDVTSLGFDDGITEGIESVKITLDTVNVGPSDPDIAIGSIGGPVLTFQNGLGGYAGTQDVFVDQSTPLTNRDTNNMEVNTDSFGAGTTAQHGLLRFDDIFGTGVIPLGSTIANADLAVWVPNSFLTATSGDIFLHQMLTDWNEGLDWATSGGIGNFLPGIQAGSVDAEAGGVMLTLTEPGLFTPPAIATVGVTSTVQDWSDGDDNFGWGMLPGDLVDGTLFLDSEFGTLALRPRLTVTLDTSAMINIIDNDMTTIDIASNVAAPNESTNGTVNVTLSNPLPVGNSLTVNYTVGGGGSATAGSDYTAVSGSFTIAGGATTGAFVVPVLDDMLIEGTEDVQVTLDSFTVLGPNAATVAANVSIGTATDSVDIIDDDGSVLTAASKPGVDGRETPLAASPSFTKPIFRVTQGASSTVPTVINYTLGGTATQGLDYSNPTTGTLTIPVGATFADLTVDLIDDELNESDETITFTIDSIVSSNPGITVGSGGLETTTDTIEDDDTLIADIDTSTDPTASEAPAVGDNTGTYVISLNKASDQPTTIPFEVTGGTADLPVGWTGAPLVSDPQSPDYTLTGGAGIVWLSPTEGYVTFPASTTPQSTTITLTATQDFDPTEVAEMANIQIVSSVTVGPTTQTLSNANTTTFHPGVLGAGDIGTVTIADEDYVVSIAKTDSPAKEDGLAFGGFNGQFTVSISNPTQSGNPVTVPFSVDDSDLLSTGIDKATYGVDYTLAGPGVTVDPLSLGTGTITGTVVIPGGASSAQIDVVVLSDNVVEGYESPALTDDFLFEDVDITIGTPVSTASIATLTAVTADQSATEHIIDNDEASVTVVPVVNQDLNGGPGGDPAGLKEDANDGGFEFKLSKAAQGRDVKVEFEVLSSSTADLGGLTPDFNFGSGVNGVFGTGSPSDPFYVIIPAGSQSTIAVIEVVSDTLVEGSEDVDIEIIGVTEFEDGTTTPADIPDISLGGPFTATATIEDNDTANVSIIANDADAREPSNIGQFTISLDKPVAVPVTVTYSIGGDASPTGDANPNDDYTALSGTYTFAANQQIAVINVNTLNDNLVEDDETVIVTIDAMTGLVTAAGTETATVIIASEDQATATLTASANADEQGESDGVFTVTLDKMADEAITFTLSDLTGSGVGLAATPGDYSLDAPGTITVPAFSLTGTLNVSPVDDGLAEGPETLSYGLNAVTSPSPYTSTIVSPLVILNPAPATMTIVDNDVPVFTVEDVTATEGFVGDGSTVVAGTTTMTFTVSHTGTLAPGQNVTITPTLSASSGTAGGSDFAMGTPASLVFTDAGPSSMTFTVLVSHDDIQEADETFTVSLGAVSTGASVTASDTAEGTILNDDFAVYTIVQTSTPNEGSSASHYPEGSAFTSTTFDITPNIPVDKAMELRVDYGGGTATGANFGSVFAPSGSQSLSFGTDYDNARDTENWTQAQALTKATKSVTVDVVRDQIVEGAAGIAGGFGIETFLTSMSLKPSDASARPGVTFVEETATIQDDDGTPVPSGTTTVPANVTVTATDPDASEPGVGFGDGLFTFNVDTPVQSDIVIDYTFTVDGATGDPNGDIDGSTPIGNAGTGVGQITIPGSVTAANTSITLPLKAFDDIVVEDDEFVAIAITGLSSPTDPNVTWSNGPIASQRVKLHDNDTSKLSIVTLDPIATEGSVTDTASFEVKLSQVSSTPTTVEVELIPSTSTDPGGKSSPTLTGSDFSPTILPGPVAPAQKFFVTIPANASSAVLTINGLNDFVTEGPEDLAVKIVGPVTGNADISIDAAQDRDLVTIQDDGDGLFLNVVTSNDASEPGTAGPDEGQVRVELRDSLGVLTVLPVGSTSTGFLTLSYTTADVTATEGLDYNAPVGLLKINEGASSGLLSIDVTDDLLVEGTESLNFTITGVFDGFAPITMIPSGPIAGESIALGTTSTIVEIEDNDVSTFSLPLASSLQFNEGDGTGTITITRDLDIPGVSVPITLVASPVFGATDPADYTFTSPTTVTFAPGEMSKTVNFSINDDFDTEPLEGFAINLTTSYSPTPAEPQVNTALASSIVSIVDNDVPPVLQVVDVKVGSSFWSPTFGDFVDNTGAPAGQRGYSIPVGAGGTIGTPSPQINALPWANLDTVFVEFNDDPDPATLVDSNFLVFSVQTGGAIPGTTVTYDTATNLAKISLPTGTVFENDRLRVFVNDTVTLGGSPLDGEWANPSQSGVGGDAFDSGNGTPGVDFNFEFNVLPGDANLDGLVSIGDAGLAYSKVGASTDGTVAINAPSGATYDPFQDINGNGLMDIGDAGFAFSRVTPTTSLLPTGSPGSLIDDVASDNEEDEWAADSVDAALDSLLDDMLL